MQKIAASRGGLCLSSNYINNHTKLLWKCFMGHEWQARPSDIIQKGLWCPDCKLSLGERCCKLIFEKSLGYEFKKIRPKWLQNKSKNNLELDGYCAKLNMAFEYNGTYHNKVVFSFQNEESLKKIQDHDSIKITQCEKRGIELFVIPEPRPFSIKSLINEIIKIVPFKVNVEIEPLELEVYSHSKIIPYNEIAKKKGGECLANTWINSQHPIYWQCSKHHIWKAKPNAIKQGQWCPQCNSHPKTTLAECVSLAKIRGGKCLTKTYKNQHTKMIWQCSKNHIWDATFSSLKHSKTWCPKCRKKN